MVHRRLFLGFLRVLQRLQSSATIRLLRRVRYYRVGLQVLSRFLSFERFFLVLAGCGLFRLGPSLLLYAGVRYRYVRTRYVRIYGGSGSDVLFGFNGSCVVAVFYGHLYLFLYELFLVVGRGLIVGYLFVARSGQRLHRP